MLTMAPVSLHAVAAASPGSQLRVKPADEIESVQERPDDCLTKRNAGAGGVEVGRVGRAAGVDHGVALGLAHAREVRRGHGRRRGGVAASGRAVEAAERRASTAVAVHPRHRGPASREGERRRDRPEEALMLQCNIYLATQQSPRNAATCCNAVKYCNAVFCCNAAARCNAAVRPAAAIARRGQGRSYPFAGVRKAEAPA